MCNFCCKFASDFNMRGPVGRAEPYRTMMLQDGDKRLQNGRRPTGLLVFLAQLDKLAQLAELDKLGIGRRGKVYKTK